MPNIRTLQRSFGGGEVTPEFFGRIDDAKYQTGLATCRNFIILPHGPAQNRPGFGFVHEVKDSTKKTRLISFTYSTDQTMVIEVGEGYFRFHTQGATLTAGSPAAYNGATAYDIGDLVASGGVNYYCIAAATGNAPPNATYWYALPATGEYEIPSPYLEADLFDIHYVQSADVLTLVHPNHAPRELRRNGATEWVLSTISFAPTFDPPNPVTGSAVLGSPGTPVYLQHIYAVTAVGEEGKDESVASENSLGVRVGVRSVKSASPGRFTSRTSHGFAINDRVYVAGFKNTAVLPDGYYLINSVPSSKTVSLKTLAGTPIDMTAYGSYTGGGTIHEAVTGITSANPAVLTVSATHGFAIDDRVYVQGSGMPSLPDGFYFVDTVPTTTTLTLRNATDEVIDTSGDPAWTTGGVVRGFGVKNDLLLPGSYNTINWPAVADATRYRVYKLDNGLYGYIGETPDTSFRDENVAPDLGRTPPVLFDAFGGAGEYPGAVSYFEQRRVFGGSINKPQNIWMTRTGTESNISYSLPSQDDDAISFRVAAREANTIRHLAPLGSLVALTGSAEWRISTADSDVVTPSTVTVRPQSYIGANNAQPVIINSNMIYAAARGGHVRELAYNWQASGYVTGDLSLRAPHLFDGLNVTDIAYAKAPFPVVWMVSSAGNLLGITYVPEQQVGAWHQHDTDGVFESVATVAEGVEDALYCVVRRTIDGNSVRYVERMSAMLFADLESAFFVDSGLTYDGAPTTSISGLDHLEGKTVSILADGAVMPQQVVTAGAITLQQAASVVHVGLPITADLKTLPLAFEVQGYGQGREKNVNKVWLRVNRSSGIFAGPNTDNLTEVKQRTTEPYGSPPSLKSEEVSVVISPSWSDSGQVVVRQSDPLPLTIVSMSMEVSIGG